LTYWLFVVIYKYKCDLSTTCDNIINDKVECKNGYGN
jgi:hypothetical protein